MRIRRLRRSELPAKTEQLARFLIGKVLVHESATGRRVGRIVETEAYPPGDEAGHGFIGKTARNAALFLERGRAYVYFSYGMHWLFNVSSESEGVGAGVLIRALAPLEGLEGATNGPGRLTVAMGIDGRSNGVDLCVDDQLWLGAVRLPVGRIARDVRIGISKAADRRLRFAERGSAYLSRPLRANR